SSWIVVWALFAFWNFSILVWNVVTVSLRQSIIPDALLGRVTSVYRWLAWGTMPIATLLGGVLVARAEPWLGPVDALRLPYFVAAGLYVVMSIWLIPRLTTERIRAAMAEAPGDDPEGTAGPATGPVD